MTRTRMARTSSEPMSERRLVGLHQATGHHDGKDDENGDRADVDEQLGHAQKGSFQKDVDAGHADE